MRSNPKIKLTVKEHRNNYYKLDKSEKQKYIDKHDELTSKHKENLKNYKKDAKKEERNKKRRENKQNKKNGDGIK